MADYRFARPEEEDQILDLIDLVFSKNSQPHDFASMLPKVYGRPGFSAHHAVAEKDGRLIGTIAMLPLAVRMGESRLRGGYIGSVAVHSRHRGEGHMKALMDLLIAEARRRDYDFLALGGQRQRYGYWGFELAGTDLALTVTRANARHALGDALPAVSFAPPTDAALDAMAALHSRLPFRCEREKPLFIDTLKSYGGVPLTILDETGALAGYLVKMGKEINELCLKDEALLPAVVKGLLREEKKVTLHVPGTLPDRALALRAFAENAAIGERERMLPLRWDRLLQAGMALRQRTEKTRAGGRNLLPDGERIIRIENEGAFLLKVENGEASAVRTDRKADEAWTGCQAVDRLFSPAGAWLLPDPLLRAWLPLPWGLDAADTF